MIELTTMRICGSELPRDNPLPHFRPRPGAEECGTGTPLPSYPERHPEEGMIRVLPYLMKDRYTRAGGDVLLWTIVLENENLRATFLPEYGGRLYSLYSKKLGRDIVYKNPVIQPANLGALGARIATGIEFCFGQYGHSATASAPVFCVVVEDEAGHDFLRVYDYERLNEVFWQLDFHLAPGDEQLSLYARVVNDRAATAEVGYWTYITLPETGNTRLFSTSEEVFYTDEASHSFAFDRLPDLRRLPGKDASYPRNFDYTGGYYFRPGDGEGGWQAAGYPEGWLFYERASAPLDQRRVFFWGNHNGGRRWKDHLSEPGKGEYVSTMSGLSEGGRYRAILPAGGQVDFCQAFGAVACAAGSLDGNYTEARTGARRLVDALLPEEEMTVRKARYAALRDKRPHRFLRIGSGYGALECERRRVAGEPQPPAGLVFPAATLENEQKPWINLLREGVLPQGQDEQAVPPSYMLQAEWEALLWKSLEGPGGDNPAALTMLGVILTERGEDERARQLFQRALEQFFLPMFGTRGSWETALALRCLAVLAERRGEGARARNFYEQALDVGTRQYTPGEYTPTEGEWVLPMYAEYLGLLSRLGDYEAVWTQYNAMPKRMRLDEQIRMQALPAAIETGHFEFARRQLEGGFAHIRENFPAEMWVRLHQVCLLHETGESISAEEARRRYPVPYRLDFGWWGSEWP